MSRPAPAMAQEEQPTRFQEPVVERKAFAPAVPVQLQLTDALIRIQRLERALQRAERMTENWCQVASSERLRLRVALQENRERMDLERYRLERLAEVARIPWWRIRKRRALMQALQEDLSAAGRQ